MSLYFCSTEKIFGTKAVRQRSSESTLVRVHRGPLQFAGLSITRTEGGQTPRPKVVGHREGSGGAAPVAFWRRTSLSDCDGDSQSSRPRAWRRRDAPRRRLRHRPCSTSSLGGLAGRLRPALTRLAAHRLDGQGRPVDRIRSCRNSLPITRRLTGPMAAGRRLAGCGSKWKATLAPRSLEV